MPEVKLSKEDRAKVRAYIRSLTDRLDDHLDDFDIGSQERKHLERTLTTLGVIETQMVLWDLAEQVQKLEQLKQELDEVTNWIKDEAVPQFKKYSQRIRKIAAFVKLTASAATLVTTGNPGEIGGIISAAMELLSEEEAKEGTA